MGVLTRTKEIELLSSSSMAVFSSDMNSFLEDVSFVVQLLMTQTRWWNANIATSVASFLRTAARLHLHEQVTWHLLAIRITTITKYLGTTSFRHHNGNHGARDGVFCFSPPWTGQFHSIPSVFFFFDQLLIVGRRDGYHGQFGIENGGN